MPLIENAEGELYDPMTAYEVVGDGDDSPKTIAARLIAELDEFRHMADGEVVIAFLMRADPKVKAGMRILGEIALPRFMGALAKFATWMMYVVFGDIPDFIMLLDLQFWRDSDATTREALVYHELCHVIHAVGKDGELRFDDDGKPVFELRGHDLEEFDAVATRYGAVFANIKSFARALASHG